MREHPPVERPDASVPMMTWDAWGTTQNRTPLSKQVRSVLESALGVTTSAPARTDSTPVQLRRSSLTDERLSALANIVGAEFVSTDDAVRMLYLGGKSTVDLLSRRSDEVQDAPDAVVFPADNSQVEELLRYCSAQSVAIVPFGGGTSVVGGVDPVREWFDTVVAVGLKRFDAMTGLDEQSRTAVLQAGVTGPQAEEMLARHGLSLGHFPQSFRFATIGGFAATRSSGQASVGYGRFDDMVEALTVVTPVGIAEPGRAPKSAAGPDLRQLFLGSEGTLGIITDVTVRVHPLPETTAYRAWWFPDFGTGIEAYRLLAVSAGRPTVSRLSDEAETGIDSALSAHPASAAPVGGCVGIMTFEGTAVDVESRVRRADSILAGAGASSVDEQAAKKWEAGRFDAPYLRDALLDAGALAETLETATNWAKLEMVRGAVHSALADSLGAAGTPPIVMCHVSHMYPTGASLYFTVVCARADDPIGQWRDAKNAATDAIVKLGATITHHHAVGRDHLPWMQHEIGPVGTALLRAIKSAVDPAGVLNPGKLIP